MALLTMVVMELDSNRTPMATIIEQTNDEKELSGRFLLLPLKFLLWAFQKLKMSIKK